MKWAFAIRRKISAALLLAAIFVLVFVKSMVDSQHVSELGTSFSSVYEDRLVVEGYIYKLSEHLFRKKIMVDTMEAAQAVNEVRPLVSVHNAAIDDIIKDYAQTYLTEEEAKYFRYFKNSVAILKGLEGAYFQQIASGGNVDSIALQLDKEFNRASGNLSQLSNIQIAVGKRLNEQSQKIVASTELLEQFEMGILIAIGLMIIVLVFESGSVFTKASGTERLN